MARISKQELYRLRNEIPIDHLISSMLEIPTQTTDGRFRFRCPMCNTFNTAIKQETNLARCFTCEKNFNSIDFVMLMKNLNFVAAIDFLRCCRKMDQDHCRQHTPKSISEKTPVHIGDVLTAIMPNRIDTNQSMDKRLLDLEQKVEYLIHRLNKLAAHLK